MEKRTQNNQKIIDDRCTKYVFCSHHKKVMGIENGKKHDGIRRCDNKLFREGLCKRHWNLKRKKELCGHS